MKLTKEQQKALKRLWDRDKADALREKLSDRKETSTWSSYLAMRRTVFPGPGCVMIPWAGMILGIEPDGHTHS